MKSLNKWMRENPKCVVTQKEVFVLFDKAYIKAGAMETAINGFKKTDIYLFDPNIFSEVDFITADDSISSDLLDVAQIGSEPSAETFNNILNKVWMLIGHNTQTATSNINSSNNIRVTTSCIESSINIYQSISTTESTNSQL